MFRAKVRRFGSISYHFLVFSHDDMVKENSSCIDCYLYIWNDSIEMASCLALGNAVTQLNQTFVKQNFHCAAYNVMVQYIVCNIRICLIHTLRGN